MDTPFGRLSSTPRENITKQIPDITKQLVLLVTDEELHSRARENLEPRIGMEYELVFDQATGCTIIKQLR
jgi:DNA sulfur modification protein DndD